MAQAEFVLSVGALLCAVGLLVGAVVSRRFIEDVRDKAELVVAMGGGGLFCGAVLLALLGNQGVPAERYGELKAYAQQCGSGAVTVLRCTLEVTGDVTYHDALRLEEAARDEQRALKLLELRRHGKQADGAAAKLKLFDAGQPGDRQTPSATGRREA